MTKEEEVSEMIEIGGDIKNTDQETTLQIEEDQEIILEKRNSIPVHISCVHLQAR